jgi:hypothetical protein
VDEQHRSEDQLLAEARRFYENLPNQLHKTEEQR